MDTEDIDDSQDTEDSRKTIKVRLKHLLQKDIDYTYLYDCIKRANLIATNGLFFLRAYILHIIEYNDTHKNKLLEPTIKIKTIRNILTLLNSTDKPRIGKPVKLDRKINPDELAKFIDIFKATTNYKSISDKNINLILDKLYGNLYECIINNITLHFEKHVRKFVDIGFYKKDLDDKGLTKKQLKKIKRQIFDDFMCNTTKCELYNNYKSWIEKYRQIIIPPQFKLSSINTNSKRDTFAYLKCMYNINKYIQTTDQKSNQFFPLRTACYSQYVTIDTSSLIAIFCEKDVNYYSTNSGNVEIQKELWYKYFHLLKNKKIYCRPNGYIFAKKGEQDDQQGAKYTFNYEIQTDGFSVSLNFIPNKEFSKKQETKDRNRKGREKDNKLKKELSVEEYDEYKNKKGKDKEKKEDDEQKIFNEKIKEKKKEFSKLPKEEQDKIKMKNRRKKNGGFDYIDMYLQNDENLKQLKEDFEAGRVLLCDPGQRSPLYMVASNEKCHVPEKNISTNNFGISIWHNKKFMNYTNKTRIKFTKRKEINNLIQKWKNKPVSPHTNYEINLIKLLIDAEIKQKTILSEIKRVSEQLVKSKNEYTSILRHIHSTNRRIEHIQQNICQIVGNITKETHDKKLDKLNNSLKKENDHYEHFNAILVDEIKNELHVKLNIEYYKLLLEKLESNNLLLVDNISVIKYEISCISKSLTEMEKILSKCNSKDCTLNKFLEYVRIKMIYNRKAKIQYNTRILNRYKWYAYINKQRHEDKLLNIIENEFGSNIKIIIGDWSNLGRTKHMSTPNKSLKIKLKERFEVYLIDEYLTSQMHYSEDIKCHKMKVPCPTEQNPELKKKLHAVLTYTKSDSSGCKISGCINRDRNAVLNIERIVAHLLETRKRLPLFKRGKQNQSIIPKG